MFNLGGLDSSLVASVACRHVRDNPDSQRFNAFPKIHSFSVGLKNSPDLKVPCCNAHFITVYSKLITVYRRHAKNHTIFQSARRRPQFLR